MENSTARCLNSSYQCTDQVEGYDDVTLGVFVVTGVTEETPLIDGSPKERGASVWKATLNIINFIEGVGFLALPFAIAKGGIAGIAAFVIMPFIYWFTAKILIECLYKRDNLHRRIRVRSSWNEIGQEMWPRFGGTMIVAIQCFDLIVIATSYLIVCGSLMASAFPSLPLTVVHWTCIAAVVVLPSTFLKSLSQIAWLSVIGIAALFGTAASVFQYIEDSSTYGRLQRKVLMPQVVYTVGIRVLLVSITLAAAAYIPHFGLLSSFFGNLSLPLFNCILPCVAHLILRKEDLKRREVCLDYVVIVFGALVTIFGTIVSTKALIETLRK
ncbi:Vesicular inhibitory amino acid transporter [Stylophora pistillata]|uniref:Vesicular inhibitory amino acid transporter n=1 Tax=Stylophora pistillata TaxID=50429 RepID=A0A2B4RCA5_STYPI|nr:Vesicular inhibitory amino acid transporter [Stylophora pistillata]